MEIHILTEETVNRIAAGEVIERPVNVVKELIENSIDAGAGAITCEIADGGMKLIRITDNGCGIEASQITKAFLRHATSKITDENDLPSISTLGFRGEALASIASVSQVEMITKTADSVSGTRVVNESLAGFDPRAEVPLETQEIGAPDGTSIFVRNLFYNIPVRKKFLKSAQTETGYITDLIQQQALSHPNISFHYRVNRQEKLHTSGNGDLKELIYRIYGREISQRLIPVKASSGELLLEGFIGRPEISRSGRSFETFFVNGRMLKDKVLSKALEAGFGTDLMQHRFPFAVLHLQLPGKYTDVNVHPAKMEIRFSNQKDVYHFIESSVHDALHSVELIPKQNLNTTKEDRTEKRELQKEFEREQKENPHIEPFEAERKEIRNIPVQNSRSGENIPANAIKKEDVHAPENAAADTIKDDDRHSPENTSAVNVIKESPAAYAPSPKPEAVPHREPVREVTVPETSSREISVEITPPEDDFVFVDKRTPKSSSVLISEEIPSPKKGSYEQSSLFENTDFSPITEEKVLSVPNEQKFKFVGQIFRTYWIVEYQDKMLMIDQHAAHEKVNYERIMKRLEEKSDNSESLVASQMIAPASILTLTGREEAAYLQFKEEFRRMGYEIEEFGEGTYAIRGVPTELFGSSPDALIHETLEEIMSEKMVGTPQVILSKVASMSCKAAVKGNMSLNEKEARALIAELLSLDNPYHCPHGRPTMIELSKYEVERKFGRIV